MRSAGILDVRSNVGTLMFAAASALVTLVVQLGASTCSLAELPCHICRDNPVFIARLVAIGAVRQAPETEDPVLQRRLTFRVLRMASGSRGDFVHEGRITVDVTEQGARSRGRTLREGWRYAVIIIDYFEGTLPGEAFLLTEAVRAELDPPCESP